MKRQLYRDQTKIIKPNDRQPSDDQEETVEVAPRPKPNRGRGRSRYQEPAAARPLSKPARYEQPAVIPAPAPVVSYDAPEETYYEPRPKQQYKQKQAYRPQPKPQYNEYEVEKPQYDSRYEERPQQQYNNEYERDDEYARKPILINTQPAPNSGYKPKPVSVDTLTVTLN